MVDEWDDEEPGLNLDNESLIVTGDQGIPIKGFSGQPATLSHEEQLRMREVHGCGHRNTSLVVNVQGTQGGSMEYRCTDCGVLLIGGHVTSFEYRKGQAPDDFNNPFITGQH